ncbi:MAG: hypothetical protein LBU19_10555 [Treponema sp.]|jgi:hypothetical protein|nr:hypothetical protein [Treponema sp.]
MARRKQPEQPEQPEQPDAEFILDFFYELYGGKWEIDNKLKEAERLRRKTSRKIREERAIIECLEECRAERRRKGPVGA